MKFNKIVLPAVLALVTLLAATGCRSNKPPKVTNVNHPSTVGENQPPPPDLRTHPFNPAENPVNANPTPLPPPYTGGPIDTATNWDPATMNIDREKLAAYTVHFKYDSAVVEDGEQANVASVGQALAADANAKLLIEGHCDERGTEEYNRSLGERRALALREALAKSGIAGDRIRTISYGKDQPLDPGHTEAAYSKNRRGQFLWCTPKTATP